MSGGGPPAGYSGESLLQGGDGARILPVQGGGAYIGDGAAPNGYNSSQTLLSGGEGIRIEAVRGGGLLFQNGGASVDFKGRNYQIRNADAGREDWKKGDYSHDENAFLKGLGAPKYRFPAYLDLVAGFLADLSLPQDCGKNTRLVTAGCDKTRVFKDFLRRGKTSELFLLADNGTYSEDEKLFDNLVLKAAEEESGRPRKFQQAILKLSGAEQGHPLIAELVSRLLGNERPSVDELKIARRRQAKFQTGGGAKKTRHRKLHKRRTQKRRGRGRK